MKKLFIIGLLIVSVISCTEYEPAGSEHLTYPTSEDLQGLTGKFMQREDLTVYGSLGEEIDMDDFYQTTGICGWGIGMKDFGITPDGLLRYFPYANDIPYVDRIFEYSPETGWLSVGTTDVVHLERIMDGYVTTSSEIVSPVEDYPEIEVPDNWKGTWRAEATFKILDFDEGWEKYKGYPNDDEPRWPPKHWDDWED